MWTIPQYYAATSMLHSWDSVPRLTGVPLFPPNILTKQFHLSFIRPEDMFPKGKVFVPVCVCKTAIWLFLMFHLMASSSLNGISTYVSIGYSSLCPQHLNQVFGFHVWWLDILIMSMIAYTMQLFFSCLQTGNCSQGWTKLVQCHNSLPDVLADFFWLSNCVEKRKLRV